LYNTKEGKGGSLPVPSRNGKGEGANAYPYRQGKFPWKEGRNPGRVRGGGGEKKGGRVSFSGGGGERGGSNPVASRGGEGKAKVVQPLPDQLHFCHQDEKRGGKDLVPRGRKCQSHRLLMKGYGNTSLRYSLSKEGEPPGRTKEKDHIDERGGKKKKGNSSSHSGEKKRKSPFTPETGRDRRSHQKEEELLPPLGGGKKGFPTKTIEARTKRRRRNPQKGEAACRIYRGGEGRLSS